ncbi:hypothetical protein Leryth_012021 [Lithospermum erythrorhizon]|nr:hypothetical protein Leryth_012021 [Lithospermum erythrorhizon]
MAFLLNKTSLFRLHSEDSLRLSRRGFHVELVAREKALLAEDPALRRFKSHKKGVQSIKRIGDVLTLAVLAGPSPEDQGQLPQEHQPPTSRIIDQQEKNEKFIEQKQGGFRIRVAFTIINN